MNKAVTIAAVVIMATIVSSAFAATVYLPSLAHGSQGVRHGSQEGAVQGAGYSTVRIYLTDRPPSRPDLSYLLVNVTSVTLRYEGVANASAGSNSTSTNSTSTTTTANSSSGPPESRFTFAVPPSIGTNVNITGLQGQALLLGSPKVPPGNVTGIVFDISGARAFYADGTSKVLKVVANGKLMIPVRFVIAANGTWNVTIDITPDSIHTSQGHAVVLTPVIHVTVQSVSSSTTTTQTTISLNTTSATTSTTTSVSTNTTISTTTAANTTSTTSVSSSNTTSA